jgi:hypothetical protein
MSRPETCWVGVRVKGKLRATVQIKPDVGRPMWRIRIMTRYGTGHGWIRRHRPRASADLHKRTLGPRQATSEDEKSYSQKMARFFDV